MKTPESRRPSVLEAYRQVLRYIHSKDLREGAKLPPQSELIQELGICSVTLDPAMKWLAEDGVLSRRRRRGTYVVRPYPERPKRNIWRAGIVMQPIGHSYFGAVLAHFLHKHLDTRGFSDRTYMLSYSAAPGIEVLQRTYADFSGLEEDVNAGLLDTILTSTRLGGRKVPLCGIATWGTAHFGVHIDFAHFLQQAMRLQLERGNRRIVYVMPYDLNEWNVPGQREAVEAVEREARLLGISFRVETIATSASSIVSFEHLFAERLLALPEAERPDGLIVQDDISAQSLAASLSAGGCRPFLVAQTHRQIPLSFALPSRSFALDIEEMARLAVDLTLEKLLVPSSPNRFAYIRAVPRVDNVMASMATGPTHTPFIQT